jgi:hypothetical protein
LITYKLIELLKVEEEHIELMVELVHIFHAKLMFKCSPLKEQLMLKDKEKPDKLPKEKSQLDNNDLHFYLNLVIFYINNKSHAENKKK